MFNGNEEAIRKTSQVFRYLQAVDQIKNPVIKDVNVQLWIKRLNDLPEHDCINISELIDDSTVNMNDSNSVGDNDNFILRIRRPENLPVPIPPEQIIPWLKAGWKDCRQEVGLIKLSAKDDSGNEIVVGLDDDQDRLIFFRKWLLQRGEWAIKQKLVLEVQSVFEAIYDLYSRIERESEQVEIMLGDGVLQLTRSELVVNHPLILQRVELEFNPAIPEFIFWESDKGTEFYSALLRSIPGIEPAIISQAVEDIDRLGVHPLGGAVTSAFLEQLVHRLSPRGVFDENNPSIVADDDGPYIKRDRILFLRKRNLGFSLAIDSILNDLSDTDSPNNFIARTVGISNQDVQSITEESVTDFDPNGEDEEVLFTKEANSEQLQIVKYLNKKGAVLVQGPPGTGKTHTIANLIGHFLSQGKSILVTSHSSKALRVLRKHVVPPLQPLCVSVLADDNRKELESSINDISERLSYSNADTLDAEALALQKRRTDILTRLRRLRGDLKTARLSETTAIVVEGNEYKPIDAAKQVAAYREQRSWIPGPIVDNEPCPISDRECVQLYQANASLNMAEEVELAKVLPAMETFIEPKDFLTLIQYKQNLEATDLSFREDFWEEPISDIYRLEESRKIFTKATEQIEGKPRWLKSIAADGISEQLSIPWVNLIQLIQDVYDLVLKHKETMLQYDPVLPIDMSPIEAQSILEEICLNNNNNVLSRVQMLFKPRWKNLLSKCKVNGYPATNHKQYEVLKIAADLQVARRQMLERWKRQISVIDGPEIDATYDNPEYVAKQYCEQCESCLRWNEESMIPAINNLIGCGLKWEAVLKESIVTDNIIDKYTNLARQVLPDIIQAQINRISYYKCLKQLEDLKNVIGRLNGDKQLINSFVDAIVNLDPESYTTNFRYLMDLYSKLNTYWLKNELIEKVDRVAPVWADSIRNKKGIHGDTEPPGSAKQAWEWKQLNDELDRRALLSIAELQEQIRIYSADLRSITAGLVEKRAWAAQARRVGDEQRLALQGWKMTMKKIGKGTGKLVPMLKAEARKLMPKCQTAVPVWIMPLSRVVDTFSPGSNRFDVVIIDEASQSDLMAHIALYMGSQIMIVGDDEQVSPIGVGQRQDEMQGLIAAMLQGIPNKHLYDSTFSIYDVAMTVLQPICLREHFRCTPEIINFSNRLSYNWKIRPLRDTSTLITKPHTVYYRVEDAESNGKVNKQEGMCIASLLVACTKQPEYDNATFGVISLVGEEQALYIDSLLRKYVEPYEREKRDILCGNSAHFQGDERDVVFLSLVDTCNQDTPLPLRREGAYNLYKKRFNVAASRARNQMWVVSSLSSVPNTDLKSGDFRLELIQHALNPYAYEEEIEKVLIYTESDFEQQVAQRLVQAGYKVVPQWKVGSYRIDMVVEGNNKRLAVECDGDRYHTIENLQQDMNRQSILERLGWQFVRIRGSQFYRTPDLAMESIFSRLSELGIMPTSSNTESASSEYELLDRVKRVAASLLQDWINEDTENNVVSQSIPPSRTGTNKTASVTSQAIKNQEKDDPDVGNKIVIETGTPIPTEDRKDVSKTLLSISDTNLGKEDIASVLTTKGIEYVDKRDVGGALWITANSEVDQIVKELIKVGYKFDFTSKGGRQTNNRPGWYTKQ